MNDSISRRAAIDAFDCTDELIVSGSANAKNVMNYINKVVGKIKALPSAQPEIIRCKDCKHRNAEDGFCEGRGWPMQLVPDDGFCDKGKRSEE